METAKSRLISVMEEEGTPFDSKSFIEKVELEQIKYNPEIQSRVKENEETVDEYADLIKEGVAFPPVKLVFDEEEKTYWIVDGNHRFLAAKKAGEEKIDAVVVYGSFKEAMLYACASNKENGLHRTNEDKRKAVLRIINTKECEEWSSRKIARYVGVSNCYVSKMIKQKAKEMTGIGEEPEEEQVVLHNNNVSNLSDTDCESSESEEANENDIFKTTISFCVDLSKSPNVSAETLFSKAKSVFGELPAEFLGWIEAFSGRLGAIARLAGEEED